MQNWNQWQLPAGAVTTPLPQPPVGYPAAPGADPMAMMQAYMQFYNQPAPSGYTAEQWAAAQQQNWTQWQQWQQQFQQWQAQYGEKYQQTVKQMSTGPGGIPNLGGQPIPSLPIIQPPPLPKEENIIKPPLPPDSSTYQYPHVPPPHQNNLPLFPSKQSSSSSSSGDTNPPLPANQQPPLPPSDGDQSLHKDSSGVSGEKRSNSSNANSNSSAKKMKYDDDELTEAEKTFDAQFKQWEEQFNKWKQQNANHPDKAQYKQYEAKWTTWREKLIERREQMRKKREQQKQSSRADAEKNKDIPGGEKILNILTSTENQGLINNLLGIGKTLGLTGKNENPQQQQHQHQHQHQQSSQSAASDSQSISAASQVPQPMLPPSMTPNMAQASWNAQQWAAQYNAGVNMTGFPNFPPPMGMPTGMPPPGQMPPPPNFSQPPPNMTRDFSQPPPGFPPMDSRGPGMRSESNNMPPDRQQQQQLGNSFNLDTSSDKRNSFGDRFGPGNSCGPSDQRMQQSGSSANDFFRAQNDRDHGFNDRPPGNQFRPNDSFAPKNDSFGRDPANKDFQSSMDDSFRRGFGNDSFNRFGTSERFGSGSDRFGPGPNPGNDRFGGGNAGFGKPSGQERFDQRDLDDKRRDSFGNMSRGFDRSGQFEAPNELAPELKKLMEKRKAAMDVFKPSNSFASSSSGSLSESFKKIAGDSPFSRNSLGDFGPRERNNFPPRGSGGFGSFSAGNEFKPRGLSDFRTELSAPGPNTGPRNSGTGDFGRRGPPNSDFDMRSGNRPNEFGGRNEGLQRGPPGLMSKPDFDMRTGPRGDFSTRPLGLESKSNEDPGQAAFNDSFMKNAPNPEENMNNGAHHESGENPPTGGAEIPPLEKPPWMEFNEEALDENKSQPEASSEEVAPQSEEKADVGPNELDKKCEALPFMGENDPKPEDLNMEPPPELPNLGPINAEISTDHPRKSEDNSVLSSPFNARNPFNAPFSPRDLPFAPRDPANFGPNDGRGQFGPRNPNDFPFNSQNRPPFNPRGLNEDSFGQRGPFDGRNMNQFPPPGRNMNDSFGFRGPVDNQFRPRGPMDAQFNQMPFRGPNDGPFGPRGPGNNHFGPRGPADNQFGPRGPMDGQFGPRGPMEAQFGPRGPHDSLFGPRGPSDGPFGPRGPSDNQFGPKRGLNDSQFVPRGPNDPFEARKPNERQSFPPPREGIGGSGNGGGVGIGPPDEFGNRGPRMGQGGDNFGNNSFPPPQGGSIPPLMSFKCDSAKAGPDGNKDFNAIRNFMPFKPGGDSESQPGGTEGPDMRLVPPFATRDLDQRQSFGGPGPEDLNLERRPFGGSNLPPDRGSALDSADGRLPSSGPGMRVGGDNKSQNYDSPMRRPGATARNNFPNREFYIEKQFNYNHGGIPANNASDQVEEHIPAKIIDYGHSKRFDYLASPSQCFDYSHGNLKPKVPEHEVYPKRDFRHWVETEQNLKEYADNFEIYERDVKWRSEQKRSRERLSKSTTAQSREENWSRSHRRSSDSDRYGAGFERDRNWYEDHRFKEKERRRYEDYERDRFEKIDRTRSKSEERHQNKEENNQTDLNNDSGSTDDRSKGNNSKQGGTLSNSLSNAPPDVSVPEPENDAVSQTPPQTLELAKTPNCTMVDDLLCPPGRQNRPPKIAIILRGPPGSGKSFVAKLIKDKEIENGGSAPRILSLDDYFLVEKEIESKDDSGKKIITKEMVYEYEEAMEQSYSTSLVKAFKKNITDGYFNFIILDSINEKISDYEDMWSFAKTKGFKVYICEMDIDLQICLKRNIHNRTEEEINRIIDYFEPTPNYHQTLDVNSMLQDQAIEEVQMEDTREEEMKPAEVVEDTQDSQEDSQDGTGVVSKWERMEADDKLDRLDGLAKRKHEGKPQTMEDFLQVPDYYDMEDTSGKKRVRWADLEERKEQEKMRAVGFVVGYTNWDRMMDPTKGGSALTRTKYI